MTGTSFTTWEKNHRACLTTRDGKPYYDWTKAKGGGEPPEGWPNGIVGRLLPEDRRPQYEVSP